MMFKNLIFLGILNVTLTLAGILQEVHAQSYPNRAVTIIVPQPPGGGVDFTGRLIAAGLQNGLQRPFVVENRAGASGNIGTLHAARASPDGYTLLLGNSGYQVTNPALFPALQWDPVRDFSGVAMLLRAPHVVVVNKNFPANTLAELVAYARANPGKLNYATPGNGTQNHIASALLAQLANVKMTHIPYKGGAPALSDLLGGTVDMFINTTQSLMKPIQSDSVKGLAIASATRHPLLPRLPTTAEAGVSGFEIATWYALYAPKGAPPDVLGLLSREIKKIGETDDFKARVDQSGATILYMGPEELDKYTEAQTTYWTAVIRKMGITAE